MNKSEKKKTKKILKNIYHETDSNGIVHGTTDKIVDKASYNILYIQKNER